MDQENMYFGFQIEILDRNSTLYTSCINYMKIELFFNIYASYAT